jgi:glutaredoxin-related protein
VVIVTRKYSFLRNMLQNHCSVLWVVWMKVKIIRMGYIMLQKYSKNIKKFKTVPDFWIYKLFQQVKSEKFEDIPIILF